MEAYEMSNSTSSNSDGGVNQRSSLAYTLSVNIIIFSILMLFFEFNRNLPRLFLKRLRKSFEMEDRVPGRPPSYLFGWIRHVMAVSNVEFLRMIGLDGYMLIRYILICFKFCSFGTVFGVAILVPIYSHGNQGLGGWQQFTLANVVSTGEVTTDALWLPAVFSYIFLVYALYLFHAEFEHFVLKRLEFLIQGDPDTFQQTHYTIMIENVPPPLRSGTSLTSFFEKLFPGEVYSAEIMLQLNDLDEIRDERSETRARLEKVIAIHRATKTRPRLTLRLSTFNSLKTAISVSLTAEAESKSVKEEPEFPISVPVKVSVPACDLDSRPHCCSGYVTVDAIAYYTHLLYQQNVTVSAAQDEYMVKMEHNEQLDRNDHSTRAELFLDYTTENIARAQSELAEKVTSPFVNKSKSLWEKIASRGGSFDGENNHTNGKEAGDNDRVVSDENPHVDNGDLRLQVSPTNSFSNNADFRVQSPLHPSPHFSPSSSAENLVEKNRGDSLCEQSPDRRGSYASSEGTNSGLGVDNLANLQEQWRGKKKSAHNEDLDLSPTNSPNSSSRTSLAPSKKKRQLKLNDATSQVRTANDDDSVGVRGNIKQVVGDVATGLGATISVFSHQGIKTVRVAGKGAIRGVLEATRTLELLTLGAYYTTSSTAFVTFKSRSARSISCQMLLSHEHYRMDVERAPNTADIIWENVSIPSDQIAARKNISGYIFNIMAVFWSAVVTFVVNFTDLDRLSDKYDWFASLNLDQFSFYDFLNQYLSVVVLLLIIVCLPFLFDFVARHYEGLKRESDVQQSIMTRFFYYQLVNVYVTVASGTIVNSIQEILDRPRSILSILGEQLPQISYFFANLLLVKTLVSIPMEMLRIWPLLQVYAVKYFRNKKKMTRRELRDGAFADLPLDYGWVYPNLLFVMMITATYSCISPFILPISMTYFGLVYLMYKYQLLYVYINKYQAGGHMWYAVFDRSMIILFCGSLVLLSYLGISKTFQTGPFYLMLPQPFCILYFWSYCNQKFIRPSAALSLECTRAIDTINAKLINLGQETPLTYFEADIYRQPTLVEPFLSPEAYRSKPSLGGRNAEKIVRQMSSGEFSEDLSYQNEQKRLQEQDLADEGDGGVDEKEKDEDYEGESGQGEEKRQSWGSGSLHRGVTGTNDEDDDDDSEDDFEDNFGNQILLRSKQSMRRLQRVKEVDENMIEDDIDMLLGIGAGEQVEDDEESLGSGFEKLSDRRSTYHSYGTTDKTFIHPRRANSSHHKTESMEEKRRRESK